MRLKSLQPVNWGPFATDQVLEIEPDVTVITGSNDTGKSSLLRLLSAIYRMPNIQKVDDELNIDHRIREADADPSKESNFGGYVVFPRDNDFTEYVNLQFTGVAPGTDVSFFVHLASASKTVGISSWNGKGWTAISASLAKMPRVLSLPVDTPVRDTIPLATPNLVERALLEVAFTSDFNAEKIKNYSRVLFIQQINQARVRLQNAMRQLLPASMNLTLEISPVAPDQTEVMIQPIELEHGFAPLGVRGSGVRAMVTLLSLLLDVRHRNQPTLILLDEPETSLHADAQHMLRGLLEGLAKLPTVQVIYATHSPSMINNMRPHSIRLLTRVVDGDRVLTKISKRPIDHNFLAVRTSLGISPADSLLYAPVTIIVEGPSDAIGVGLLLPKLQQLHAPGFEHVEALLPQCHLVDGEGDSYIKQIPMALSQKSKAVVFLDGDKKVTPQTRAEFPSVPFILLDNNVEFEELIDCNIYFRALDQILRQNEHFQAASVTPEAFDTWVMAQDDSVTRRAYTKRVEAWLRAETHNAAWDKPAVLKAAIMLIDNQAQVQSGKLAELVQTIRSILPSVT